MYAIIYWLGDDEIYPLLALDNKQLKLFGSLAEADRAANAFESRLPEADCRVISIESVTSNYGDILEDLGSPDSVNSEKEKTLFEQGEEVDKNA